MIEWNAQATQVAGEAPTSSFFSSQHARLKKLSDIDVSPAADADIAVQVRQIETVWEKRKATQRKAILESHLSARWRRLKTGIMVYPETAKGVDETGLVRFKTDVKRMRHPQARLIPYSIWVSRDLFDRKWPIRLTPLMLEQNWKRLCAQLSDGVASVAQNFETKQCLWLAIYYSHPSLSLECLMTMCRLLGFNWRDELELAMMIGQEDLFHRSIHASQKPLVELGVRSLFYRACEYGHLNIVESILNQIPSDQRADVVHFDRCRSFHIAVENHHADLAVYLIQYLPIGERQGVILDYGYLEFYEAIADGQIQLVKCMLQNVGDREKEKMLGPKGEKNPALDLAIRHQHKDIVEYLLSFDNVRAFAKRHRDYACYAKPLATDSTKQSCCFFSMLPSCSESSKDSSSKTWCLVM